MACTTIFRSSHLRSVFSVRVCDFIGLDGRYFGSCFFTALLHLFEVCSYPFMHSPLEFLQQHLSQVEVCSLTGPLQHLYSFLFQPFCCWFAEVVGIIGPNLLTVLMNKQKNLWLINSFVPEFVPLTIVYTHGQVPLTMCINNSQPGCLAN